jgi:hypothetical protein
VPRSEPDTRVDLPGTAIGTTSPLLTPGRWYFHLRTEARGGDWTHTVHRGPYIIVEGTVTQPGAPLAPGGRSRGARGGSLATGSASGTTGSAGTSVAGRASATGGAPTESGAPAGGGGATTPPTGNGTETVPAAGGGGGASPPASPRRPRQTPLPDTTAPGGQGITLEGGPYYRTPRIPLTLAQGSDARTGVDPRSGVIERSAGVLAAGECTDWSGWTVVRLQGGADTDVADGRCYRYRVADYAGNRSAFSQPSGIAYVDAAPPTAPTLNVDASGDATYVDGTTVYYRPAGAGGRFTVTAASQDSGSGLRSIVFPALADGFAPTSTTERTAAPYEVDYSWSTGGSESGEKSVTAADAAGNTAATPFDLVADPDGPTGVSASVSGGPWFTRTSVPVAVAGARSLVARRGARAAPRASAATRRGRPRGHVRARARTGA